MNKINFYNDAQRILWECEIKGQLSDGFWENRDIDPELFSATGIHDWKKPVGCNFTHNVKVDITELSAYFDVSLERMIQYVKMKMAFPNLDLSQHSTWLSAPESDLMSIKWLNCKSADEAFHKISLQDYNIEKLSLDLSAINTAIQIKNPANHVPTLQPPTNPLTPEQYADMAGLGLGEMSSTIFNKLFKSRHIPMGRLYVETTYNRIDKWTTRIIETETGYLVKENTSLRQGSAMVAHASAILDAIKKIKKLTGETK